jgi:pimeloyl-ACP methyl ester carboxylesterase
MRCLVGGEGRPLLLCHGFLSSAEEFGGRFRDLAAERRLIIPDLPGNGGSAPLAVRHTADAMAASLDELLALLGVIDFDLAGLCLGASVAMALAGRCGPRVGHLVLHTPLIAPSLIRRRYRGQVRVLTMPPLWQGVVALSRNRVISDLYKRFVIQEGAVDSDIAAINFANQRRADPAAAREWLRDGMRHGSLVGLVGRPSPTLVIVAGHDRVVDIAGVQRLIAADPRITLHVDEEQGHGWSRAAVERQLAVMTAFLGVS